MASKSTKGDSSKKSIQEKFFLSNLNSYILIFAFFCNIFFLYYRKFYSTLIILYSLSGISLSETIKSAKIISQIAFQKEYIGQKSLHRISKIFHARFMIRLKLID